MSHTNEAVGPVLIDVPALNTGEQFHINLRQRTRNGRTGWWRPYLPIDFMQVTNPTTETLTVTTNNEFRDIVVSKSTESYEDMSIEYVTVQNSGSASIAADEVTVALEKTPYDADDRARDERNRSKAAALVENLTGIPL